MLDDYFADCSVHSDIIISHYFISARRNRPTLSVQALTPSVQLQNESNALAGDANTISEGRARVSFVKITEQTDLLRAT